MMEKQSAVRFDATDLSSAYWRIVREKYGGDRKIAEQDSCRRIKKLLQLPALIEDENLQYVLKNWCVLLMNQYDELHSNKSLLETVKKIIFLKAEGSEEEYMMLLQNSQPLRKLV